MTTFHYIDTSALAKLLGGEPEREPLVEWMQANNPSFVSSDLAAIELTRCALRLDPNRAALAQMLLADVALNEISREVMTFAGLLRPTRLGSLDAIHIATALLFGKDLAALITYDKRMAEAARLNGLAIVSPGAEI